MPSIKKFRVILDPVTLRGGIKSISYSLVDPSPSKEFESTTLEGARQIVNAFAAEHGKPCHASVRSLDARKPSGFNKVFDFHSLFFNINGEQQ